MNSVTRTSFWRAYAALDPRIKQAARVAYQLFFTNRDHPSLRFKKLQGYDNVWSVRISEQYRAVGERKAIRSSGHGSDRTMSSTASFDVTTAHQPAAIPRRAMRRVATRQMPQA